MIGVWRSLLWKEWREQRSVLLILTSFFVFLPAIFSLRTPTNYFGAMSITLFAIPLVSMFVAMNIAAGEQASGTIGFLQSLPVSRRKWATAKLLWAMLVVVIPILTVVGVAALLRQLIGNAAHEAIERDALEFGIDGDWFATRLIVPIVTAVSFLLWMAAPGVNRSDEVRAGAIGLLTAVAYWVFVALIAELVKWFTGSGASRIVSILSAIGAGGIAIMDPPPTIGGDPSILRPRWAPYATVMFVTHLTLAAWFVLRFGRVIPDNPLVAESSVGKQGKSWLAPPRRSPLEAIIWKQVRESLPLAALGALSIAVIALVIYFGSRRSGEYELSTSQSLTGIGAIWMIVGLMVATVAGIGVFVDDLTPGINTFWRSRPIRIGSWFAVKDVTGLLITVFTLAIPLLLTTAGVLLFTDGFEDERLREETQIFVAIGALGQVAMYSSSLAAMVLLRRPIHAAFVSMAVTYGAFVASVVLAGLARMRIADEILLPVMAVLYSLAALLLAWLAVRRDWGWKR